MDQCYVGDLHRSYTSGGGEVDKKTKHADDHLDCHCEVHGHPIVQLNLFDILHGQEQAAQRGRCRGVRGCGRCEADMSFLGHTSPASPSTSSTSWRANPKAPGLYKRGVFWEVFSGSGRLTQAISAERLRTLPPIDIKKGCAFDLSRRSTQILIKQQILEEKVSFLHLGTPCIVFSNARRNIRNLIRARARERVAELARLCHRHQTQWSIENPASSRLWQFPAIEELRNAVARCKKYFTHCRYGAEYKKPAMLLTKCELLDDLQRSCTHKRHQTVLQGRKQQQQDGETQWVNATELAYPLDLCKAWAQAVKPTLLNVSEKSGSGAGGFALRFEEAANKGRARQLELCKDLEKSFPKILESITFGQHSRAEASRRRQKRNNQKACRKTTAGWSS